MVDGCPECVYNTEAPKSTTPTTDGHRAAYLCADCGHAWTTDWRADPIEQSCETRGLSSQDAGDLWDTRGTRKDGPGGALTPLFRGLDDQQREGSDRRGA